METGFDDTQWQRYTLLAGMFIFVDLTLFLTPTISKIGGAEFASVNEVESVNEEMKKLIVQTKNRSKQLTSLLDIVDDSLFGTFEWSDIEEYQLSLEGFLQDYGDACRQDITVFLKINEVDFSADISRIIGIELTKEQLESLLQENVVQLDNYNVLIPFTQRLHPVVIAIVSEKEPLLQIDFEHIIDLAVIHTWYQKKEGNS